MLQVFDGTILLVSHDRYLIDALATQIWDVLPDERLLKVFPGSYSEYAAFRRLEKEDSAKTETTKKMPDNKPGKQSAASAKPTRPNRKQQELMQKLEADISRLETELENISSQLENPPEDPQTVQELGMKFNQIQQSLDAQMEKWENLSAEM